jgi:hypothetical protein
VFHDLNPGRADPSAEGYFNVLAGCIAAGMQDTGEGMGCLFGKGNFTIKGIKWNSELNKVSDSIGSLLY